MKISNKELLKVFLCFIKIGAFTLGGGYAMLPIMESTFCGKGYIKQREFMDVLIVAQSAPGAIAVNSAVFIGYKLKGIKGSLVCLLGVVLPSFTIIILVATLLYRYRELPLVVNAFLGIKPAVFALILSAVIKLWRGSDLKGLDHIVPIIAFLMAYFLETHPLFIMALAAVYGIVKISTIRGRVLKSRLKEWRGRHNA